MLIVIAPADLLAVAQGLYAFNRFLASGLMMMKAFKPRYMLGAYLFLCFVFSVAAMNTSGTTSIALLILVFCFESVSEASAWPDVFLAYNEQAAPG